MSYVKKLYRSKKNRMLTGVCGGIGERAGIDPTVIRLIWVIISFLLWWGLGGIILYFLFTVIIPEESGHIDV